MRTARVLAALLTAAALTACAGRPSVADLPERAVAEPAPSITTELEYTGRVLADGGEVVAAPSPRNPVEAFRAFEVECSQYAALAGRDDPTYPRVEPDRFAGASLLQELDADTAIVVDGRGTVLRVDTWITTPALLPDGAGELPDPYRLGCPPEPVLRQAAERSPGRATGAR